MNLMILHIIGVAIGGFVMGDNILKSGKHNKMGTLLGMLCVFFNTVSIYNLIK